MKSNVIRMFLALGAACVGGSALDAQTYTLSAKIPFTFQVADKVFPAGKYQLAESGYRAIPQLMEQATGHSIFIGGASHSLTATHSPKLVFHCYGPDSCFLAEIWPMTGLGSTVPKTKAEKEILKGDRSREMATIIVDLHRAD